MLISHTQLQEINKVQIDILSAVADVCKKLDVKFFMVHGSLLGTIRDNKFVPDDDDIDIALARKDYDLFMEQAQKYLPEYYFVQTNTTDPFYPLAFGKVRDSRTTYIVEGSKHLNINHGIYIDIFPIDNCIEAGIKAKMFNLKYKLLNMRIASVYNLTESTLKKLIRFITRIIFPGYKSAVKTREKMLKNCKASGYVRMSGGKAKEQRMPASWFENAKEDIFEGVNVFVPGNVDNYLTRIYGDYKNRTLIEDKISDSENIQINASVIDINESYKKYVK